MKKKPSLTFQEDRYTQKGMASEFNRERLAKIRALLPKSGTLLEIGAWDGTTIRFYREQFKGEAWGIDISLKVLKNARPFFDGVKACDLNRDRIPFADGRFDTVICGEVIEHIYDTDRLLQEIRRIMKNDGTLIISTPNLASFMNRLFILLGYQPVATEVSSKRSNYGNKFRKDLIPAGHIRNFTYRAFREILETNGFRIVRQSSSGLSENRFFHGLETLAGKLSTGLGSDIIFQCVKKIKKIKKNG